MKLSILRKSRRVHAVMNTYSKIHNVTILDYDGIGFTFAKNEDKTQMMEVPYSIAEGCLRSEGHLLKKNKVS